MSKLRPQKHNNKINGKIKTSQGCSSEQYPWFSFRYMTRNSKHNLNSLPIGSEREKTLLALHQRLEEISNASWLYWNQQPKNTGLETIEYHRLYFEASKDAKLSKDTTLYIFRFDTHTGTAAGRIIGFKESPCAVLHIIGYDFDFSAYDHGG